MEASTPASRAAAGKAGAPAQSSLIGNIREFLAFKLGAEEYGIDILRVQEIRSFEQPTRIANAPSHVLGVVNLRGTIVPIVDMRVRFNLEQSAYDAFTVVIVLHIGQRVVGMVVDGVSDVITLSPEQLRPVPEFNSVIDSEHLMAIGALDQRMLILLDIEKLMASPDMGLVDGPMH
ncbi:MAG: chemotaxis protein CheW [Rubrivivax sp.]|nr:chemotaxis protein CheW [Rubrivivax sp.]